MATHGNPIALRCLNAAIDGSPFARKDLADQLRMSEGQFSKLTSGQQGSLDLIDRLPEVIRQDYARRLHDACALDAESRMALLVARFVALGVEVLAELGTSKAKLPVRAGAPVKAEVK